MTKEEFIKLIKNALNYSKELDRWSDFGIDLFELPIAEISWDFFNIIIESVFSESGIDIINWWLFEKNISNKNLKTTDKNGNILPSETIEDLWEIVKKYRK